MKPQPAKGAIKKAISSDDDGEHEPEFLKKGPVKPAQATLIKTTAAPAKAPPKPVAGAKSAPAPAPVRASAPRAAAVKASQNLILDDDSGSEPSPLSDFEI